MENTLLLPKVICMFVMHCGHANDCVNSPSMRTISQIAVKGNVTPESLPVKAYTPPPNVDPPAPPVISPTVTIQPDKLTWARTCIKHVQYNATVKAWLDHDQAFANWLRTCVMLHADSGAFETKATIPDQWREDIGEFVTIVTANCIPGKPSYGDEYPKHEVKEGIYHVMA